jgi:hypothetical protein
MKGRRLGGSQDQDVVGGGVRQKHKSGCGDFCFCFDDARAAHAFGFALAGKA